MLPAWKMFIRRKVEPPPARTVRARMQIERVEYTPRKDVYHPGDVINIAIYFRSPFVGQCEVGLVPKNYPPDGDFARTTFARSSNLLYEGQIYLRDSDIGACKLWARLTPVKGEGAALAVGDQIFEIRPLTPIKR